MSRVWWIALAYLILIYVGLNIGLYLNDRFPGPDDWRRNSDNSPITPSPDRERV